MAAAADVPATDWQAATRPLAGLGRRLLSLVYESLLLAALVLVAGFLFLGFAWAIPLALGRPALQLYLLAVCGVYFVGCWRLGGQTLPMKTWRLRLVTRAGGPIEPRQAIARYVLAVVGIGLGGLAWAWALFDPERQFLHDRLAGTRIVFISSPR